MNPYEGPYSFDNGQCAYGHAVNGMGRCKPLNDGDTADPTYRGCPSRLERLADLENMAWGDLCNVAAYWEIPIPNGLQAAVKPILISTILLAEGYPQP